MHFSLDETATHETFQVFRVPQSAEERKEAMASRKCFRYGEGGHRYADCPNRSNAKEEHKAKKPKPSARLIPDLIGEKLANETTKLCGAWSKRH